MKDAEDEAFDDLARRQGMWGGGFPAKRAMAADKMHWSDCAVHNGPAYPAGECDCGATQPWNEDEWRRNNWRCGHGWLRGEQCEICNAPKQHMAADKLWDKPSVAFDEWWNDDKDENTNPFRLESGAYWAWAGWKAALAQPAQEPVGKLIPCSEGWFADIDNPPPTNGVYETMPLYTAAAQSAQEPVCDKDPQGCWNVRCQLGKQCHHAQPAQEPVARVSGTYGGRFTYDPINRAMVLPIGMALYAGPPQHEWVGLTFGEICECESEYTNVFARNIEAKLKEKNNGT